MKKVILPLHKEILNELQKYSGQGTKHTGNTAYLGNNHFSYHISNPLKRKIARAFISRHREISIEKFTELVTNLYKSNSYDEKTMAGMLLGYLKNLRAKVNPKSLDAWLEHLNGWAEVDSLCQGIFTVEDMFINKKIWIVWKKILLKFSVNSTISKRRASLVLLTGPISHSTNPLLIQIAFKNIDALKAEKDILITKAISWLLRNMVKHHKKEVIKYLAQNSDSLPKIAVRETQRKILTGRK